MTMRVVARTSRCQTRVLGSRFIAHVAPVAGEGAGRSVREALGREFPDATHHCWGLSLRTRLGERALSDDAGEPAGTAGVPILQAIQRAGVTNVIVVVIRYFGGTRLGKGGLARAYRDAARGALAAAGSVEVLPVARVRLSGSPELDGSVRHLLARRSGRVVTADYAEPDRAVLVVEVPEGELPGLREDLARLTRGGWTAAETTNAEPSGG